MVLLPDPDTPITISAQGAMLGTLLTKILRHCGLVQTPDRLALRASAGGGQVFAIEYTREDRAFASPAGLEHHLVAGSERRKRQRHPRHERFDMGFRYFGDQRF